MPIQSIADSLNTVSRADGLHAQQKKRFNMNETPDEIDHYSLFDIYFPLFFTMNSDQYTLTIQPYGKKKSFELIVKAMSLSDRSNRFQTRFGKLPVNEDSWQLVFPEKTTAYMKFGTFAFWNSNFNTKKWIDSALLSVIRQTDIQHLIIDLRNNEGGDNSGDYILSYLTESEIGCDNPDRPCSRYLQVPDTLQRYLSTWDKEFRKPKDSSQFHKNELGLYEPIQTPTCAYIKPQPKRFTGKVYVIIHAKNSSATFEMARNVKDYHLATLLGTTTGGCEQGINGGEFFFLTLPASKIEIDLPLIYNYHPNKPDSGIEPDIVIETTQESIAKGRDVQLQYILSTIKSRHR